MPDSSPATLAAALPLLDQAIVWLGWCDHPDCSRSSDKKTTLFLSLRLPLVSGHFVSILWAKNTGRKRTSGDDGCSPVLLPYKRGRMSEIDADQCHFVMPFTRKSAVFKSFKSFKSFKNFKNFPWQKHIKNQCVETCMA